MSTIADKLQDLIDAKADMKSAIEEKGITIIGGLDSYADAIDQIDINGGSVVYLRDGTKLAYSSWPIETSYEDGKFIQHTLFPNIDFTYVTDMSYMFYNCNMTDVPISTMNLSNITNTSYMFYNCTNLDHTIDFTDANNVVDMSYMFASTNSIVGDIDTVKVDISNCKSIRGLLSGSADIYNVYFKGELLSDCDIRDALKISGVNQPMNIYYDYRYDYSRLISDYGSYKDYGFLDMILIKIKECNNE